MKDKFETGMEEISGVIFSMIPVENLVINSIDRLGEYLLVYVPFLQFDDYQTVVELDENEKKLLAILLSINILTGRIETFYKDKHLFNEIPGIGLEVSYAPLSRDKDLYPIIFMNRNDEVYMTCRYYITKACRTFAIPSLQSIFSELFAALEGIGMIGCQQFANFTKENKRIMAVICDNQNEYEANLDTFCFYSEVLRTLVLHQGHSLLEFMDRKSAFRLLTDIFWKIIDNTRGLLN